jgi:hypothetical protein
MSGVAQPRQKVVQPRQPLKRNQISQKKMAHRKRAEDKVGELSAALEKAERVRTDLRPAKGKQTKAAALKTPWQVYLSPDAAFAASRRTGAAEERRVENGPT